jgi:hypothetical protein
VNSVDDGRIALTQGRRLLKPACEIDGKFHNRTPVFPRSAIMKRPKSETTGFGA